MLLAASRGEARDLVSATPVAKRASIPAGKAKRIQCDEIWSFCYSKQKNVATAKRQDLAYGDVWTWTGLDADSKLIVSWMVGGRDSDYAMGLMDDLRSRLANRVQLTTDGHRAYLEAIEGAFGGDIDYAMLVKLAIAGVSLCAL